MTKSNIRLSKRRYKELKRKFEEDPQNMGLEELAEYYRYLEQGAK